MLNFLVRPGHGRPAILNRRKTWRIRLLFAERTPLGYRAALTRDRWREIIRFKHPALAGHEAAVRDCLRDPDLVRESAQDPDVHLFYRRTGRNYLCVVTAGQETADRFVVTAYFTKNIKQG
ncbi:MAG TPA: hypothetical protein VNH11_34080, partial [Pirellulales bacterium]|nr:hypothetical protein [Pirellulales bacterium]